MNENEFNKVFSKRLRYYLSKNDMTQLELSKRLGVGTTSVSNWCQGLKSPRMDKVDAMCDIFHCSRSDLIEDKPEQSKSTRKGVTINVLGNVAAGLPIEAVEQIIDTEEISEEMAATGEFFGLRINGDSMEPRICKGDIVIVKQQEDAETGDIVIALINGSDATCKRLLKYAGGISLLSINSRYEPMVFTDKDVADTPVRIIGKVVELRAKL